MVWCVELCVGVWMVCCMELGARELGMHSAMGMEAGMAFAHARVGQHVRDARVPISRKIAILSGACAGV